MITAILAVLVTGLLFYGKVSMPVLAPLSAGLGVAVFLLGRHKHSRFLAIDIYAQISRLGKVSAMLKFWTVLALTVLCVLSENPVTGIFLAAVMLILIVFAGGLRLREYIRLLTLPVSFLLIGAVALLVEVSTAGTADAVLSVFVFGFRLTVSTAAQIRAALVIARAFGALSCLYMLGLTTPMSELIGVLRRVRCPGVIIGLMYLIYRYIFILLNMYHTMRDAAKSRLGFINYRASVRTTGGLYANLFSRSYRQAGQNFDAMESRGFDTEIRFLEKREKITAPQLAAALGLIAASACLTLVI